MKISINRIVDNVFIFKFDDTSFNIDIKFYKITIRKLGVFRMSDKKD